MSNAIIANSPTAAPERPQPVRLSVTPAGERCRLDGAWWPRSRDLARELPSLVAELDVRWGRITHATVNRHLWASIPHRVRAGAHTVHLGWFDAEQDPYEISLFSYHVGRWDLLVVPPETDPVTAGRLMAAATQPGNRHSASELVDSDSVRRWGMQRWNATAPRDWHAEQAAGFART